MSPICMIPPGDMGVEEALRDPAVVQKHVDHVEIFRDAEHSSAGSIRPSGAEEMGTSADTPPGEHDSLREGVTLGLVVATSIWAWVAVVDVVAGDPFRTFTVLGGVVLFTVMHYLLNVAYGVAIVSGIHGAAREPGVIMGVAFGFLMVEIAFALVTVVLSNLGLGELAWVRIFGGSLFGAVIAIIILSRRHPLAARLRQAEEET
jgi:hypothetical protein